jgi:hypothetical protein
MSGDHPIHSKARVQGSPKHFEDSLCSATSGLLVRDNQVNTGEQ